MLVYGDHSASADPRERLTALAERLVAVGAMPAGIDRHAKLVGALVEAGQLLQGVADANWAAEELGRFVYALALCVVQSWDSRFADVGELPAIPHPALPARVELRLPEGFAFYAVYPESYIEPSRRLTLSEAPRVIGIRSIGTTLGAIVAAALRAPPPVTVRPFGDPFARQVELPLEIIEHDAHYVIADEGPGLSGSSFGATADWLTERGVPLERIAFMPSHGGNLGPQASDAHRRRWCEAQRSPAEFDPQFLAALFGPLEEFSTGHPWERRKFVARQDEGRVLLKFAGLGAIGERKLKMARTLHAAGLTPEPLGFVHGFLVERWRDDARPLRPNDKPVEALGRYIGARARLFPARDASGATTSELREMCRRNISLGFGEKASRIVDRWNMLDRCVLPICTDNKLDRDEWLRADDGLLLKCDALDHHQSHDLIGCQPVEWDIAGAIAEFELNERDAELLVDASGCRIDPELLDFYGVAYPAFRFGQAQLAAQMVGASSQISRLERNADRYARRLELLLHESTRARESAVFLA
jgi:hypothetical protein